MKRVLWRVWGKLRWTSDQILSWRRKRILYNLKVSNQKHLDQVRRSTMLFLFTVSRPGLLPHCLGLEYCRLESGTCLCPLIWIWRYWLGLPVCYVEEAINAWIFTCSGGDCPRVWICITRDLIRTIIVLDCVRSSAWPSITNFEQFDFVPSKFLDINFSCVQ